MTETAQLSYSTLPPEREPRGRVARTARWFALGLFWTWLGGAVVAGLAFAVARATNGFVGAMASIAALLLLIAGAMLARGVRRIRDLSVLHYLEHAVRLNAPVTRMLAAAEQNEVGAVRLGLRRLRRRLEAGDAISTALSISTPAISRRMRSLVFAGESTGQAPAAMRRITHRGDILPLANATDSIFHRWYPPIVLAGCFAVAQACLIFVLPKFNYLLRDDRLPQPPAMRLMQLFSADLGLAILCVSALAILLLCGRMLALLFTARGMTLGPLRPAVDAAAWFTPVACIAVRSMAMSDVCFVIAHALEAGMAPNRAIVEAAAASGNVILERRMRRWAAEILAGNDLAAAARKARLPALLVGMLSTSRTDDDAQEIFQFLHRYYDNKFSRAAMLLRGAIMPLVAIGGGIIVLAIALGVFEPLVALMKKTMEH